MSNRLEGRVPLKPVLVRSTDAIGRGKVGMVAPIPRCVPAKDRLVTDDVMDEMAAQLIVA